MARPKIFITRTLKITPRQLSDIHFSFQNVPRPCFCPQQCSGVNTQEREREREGEREGERERGTEREGQRERERERGRERVECKLAEPRKTVFRSGAMCLPRKQYTAAAAVLFSSPCSLSLPRKERDLDKKLEPCAFASAAGF